MSAVRISRPGHPTELRIVDDGAVGRITFSRTGIYGLSGALETAAPPQKRSDGSDIPEHRRAQIAAAHARYRERHR
jgi:hypothetical protein